MDCPHCDKKISTRSNLVRHINNIHKRDENGSSHAKKPKLVSSGVPFYDNLDREDSEKDGHSDTNVPDNSGEDAHSDDNVPDNSDDNGSTSSGKDAHSDTDGSDNSSEGAGRNNEDAEENEITAWRHFSKRAAALQQAERDDEIEGILRDPAQCKMFLCNLRTLLAVHRRLDDYLTEGTVYPALFDEVSDLKKNGYHESEVFECAWRNRKYLIKKYLIDLFTQRKRETPAS